ncbi:MAG: hypothetical protein KC478_15485 [Bacteriovoracaceae bacterium]|nr:hypothetical protein [Bacteriovoracaceae bacterium]
MDTTQKNLVSKAVAGNLGHFFIVNPPGRAKDPKKDLMRWVQDVVQSYFMANESKTEDIKNNEDILVIDEEMINKKFYDKSIVDLVSKFLSHLPTRADRKFVIIEDLGKMSDIHNNKLLKVFEEPPVNATIFLINPNSLKVLPTIASRAVFIRAMIRQQELGQSNLETWVKKLEKKNMHQFCDFFKTRKEEEMALAQALIDRIEPNTRAALFRKAQRYLKEHAEDSIYNHNSYSRLAQLREIYLEVSEGMGLGANS